MQNKITVGIIREGRVPHDFRTPFTPDQIAQLNIEFPAHKFVVQHSPFRCYSDNEYLSKGVEVCNDMSHCDILFGIKEVPVDELIADKTYFFFSHTIKKQEHNRKLLQTILKKNIRLIDYECLTKATGERLIGFGRYAGIVGTYNSFLAYGKKYGLFDMKPAIECKTYQNLIKEIKPIKLPPIKILFTGNGRVSHGALEILRLLKIKSCTPDEIRTKKFNEPVYAQLMEENYNEHKNGRNWEMLHFYKNPSQYVSTMNQFISSCVIFIHCAFWHREAPVFFTNETYLNPEFTIKVIGDISCDLHGPIPSTLRSSTNEDPVYGYDAGTQKETNPYLKNTVDVMAVDNLPCALPRDTSNDFGIDLSQKVVPALLSGVEDDMIDRATITKGGRLTMPFEYLSDFVQ
ncbi:MAG: hypothetical protein A3G23_05155 [Bacteroidetes bacterium RIFCSPLOWO2_12_FULL_37_12]|nr:MAG: hypothetical protein A3G23_05155 [Bacteroidetes bacterium RIFCSPLOWO2_12_FULL_37_12]